MTGQASALLKLDSPFLLVVPTANELEILPAIPLAPRKPLSPRVGLRLIHPDRTDRVHAIQFSPDGSSVIGNTYPKNNIQVWDVQTGKQSVTINTPDEGKSSSHFCLPSADFYKFYTWFESRGQWERVKVDGRDGVTRDYPESRIQVWRASDGELIEELENSDRNQIRYLSLVNDRYLCSFEAKSGTWFDLQPRVQRVLDLETRQWSEFPDSFGQPAFNRDGQTVAAFVGLEPTLRYVDAISVSQFPSLDEVTRFKLPEGVHAENRLAFTPSGQYLVAEYRTYERRNQYNKWKTQVVCFDIKSQKRVGEFRFPYDNDSPLFPNTLVDDENLMMVQWRSNPRKLTSIQLPEMKVKWEVDIGEYRGVQPPVIAPGGRLVAVICYPPIETQENLESVDWDLQPQPEMKLIDCQTGKLLETLILPVGASDLAFSPDGRSAAIGAVGSVYLLNFSDLVDSLVPHLPEP